MDLSRKRQFTLIYHLSHPLQSWISSFLHPTMDVHSVLTFCFLFSGKEIKTQRASKHLCNIGATHNFLTCWTISLCPEVWHLITIPCRFSLVLIAVKLLSFWLDAVTEFVSMISSCRELSRYASWCVPNLLSFAFPGPFIHQDCKKKRENFL